MGQQEKRNMQIKRQKLRYYKYECLTVDKEWTEIAGGQTIEYLDEGNEILLYPKYVREEYTIYFHFLERNDVQVVHFCEAIQYPIDTDYMLAFYTIDGWYNVSNNVKFTENNWPDLTPNDENNGSLYLELRGNYKTFNVSWDVPALTYDGKAIDTALYNLNVGTTSYTYFMTINAGTIDSVAYELLGWYESSTFEESTLLNEAAIRHYGDRTFYAKLKMKQYTITFNSNGGTSCASMTVDYGSTITLPISTKSNYKGSWNTWTMDGNLPVSNFGDEHTVLQDKSFTVSWKRYYNIVYRNLVFMGQTAEVLWDNWLYVDAPNYYFYGYTFELERASAYMQADGPYDEQLRFLGWYTSMSFVTKKTSISSSQTGTVYVYAKWRYDFNYGGRYGTNTVTDASQMNQEYDQLYLGLGYDNLHQELLNIGIKAVTITFKINMWRTADQGTQYIYFYGGSDGTTLLQQYSFTVGSTETVKTINFAFDLESLGTINYIYVRYKASTSGWWLWEKSDTWKNDETHYEIVYVAQEADKNALEFYWSYKDPFD